MEGKRKSYVNIIVLKKEELREKTKQNKKGSKIITKENLK